MYKHTYFIVVYCLGSCSKAPLAIMEDLDYLTLLEDQFKVVHYSQEMLPANITVLALPGASNCVNGAATPFTVSVSGSCNTDKVTLELTHLNGMQPPLMLLITPVLFLQVHVKMSEKGI